MGLIGYSMLIGLSGGTNPHVSVAHWYGGFWGAHYGMLTMVEGVQRLVADIRREQEEYNVLWAAMVAS